MTGTITKKSFSFCILLLLGYTVAPKAANSQSKPGEIDWSYLYDGGAIPFVYGSAIWFVASEKFIEPPDSPRFFSDTEGGATPRGDTVPTFTLPLGAIAAASLIGFGGDDSKWFHLKGILQSTVTNSAITNSIKLTFGRQRPDYQMGDDQDSRRSFVSGHASSSIATLTYISLFMRKHGFKNLRGDRFLPWWEGLFYAGTASLAVYVPLSRVLDNRHHVTDVVTGGLLGAATSSLFFFWQERRYKNSLRAASDHLPNLSLSMTPSQKSLQLSFVW